MTLLARIDLAELGEALRSGGLDGWLLFDFHDVNPVLRSVTGITGMATRRLFIWLPAQGRPVAIAHRIELGRLQGFPGDVHAYSTWEELHTHLADLVRGRRIAMEVSADDAVPYLDRIPWGVVGLLERLGATVRSSAGLVTRFAARWSPEQLRDHRTAAERLADIARRTLTEVVREVGRAREADVQARVLERMSVAGLETTHPPIVAFGANAASPHYEPQAGRDAVLAAGEVVLLDLWGGVSRHTVFADQTWMGFAGSTVPDEVQRAWVATRDARDAVVKELASAWKPGAAITGAALDRVARGVLESRGFGSAFVHRTGHSIDLELHGSGPHLDSFETNDVRELAAGCGFSVEPGVYLAGRFGIRSEINVVLHRDSSEVTPARPQVELIVAT